MLKRLVALLTLVAATLLGGGAANAQSLGGVTVNGVPLSEYQLFVLEYVHDTAFPSGAYWYDPLSGLWGEHGGPARLQLLRGMKLGGALRADASRGTSGVYLNGRQLPTSELQELQYHVGHVPPGRYRLDSDGLSREVSAGGSGSRRAPATGDEDGYIERTQGGTIVGAGECFGYSSGDATVLVGC
jgi:hypothetical protein